MLPGLMRLPWKRRRTRIRDHPISTQLARLFGLLFIMLSLHTAAMVRFENLLLGDALWLTITTVTTVGYGDLSPQTVVGRAATTVLLYVGGIAVLAQVVSLYFERRQEVRSRKLRGDWRWIMEDHLVFFDGSKTLPEGYFFQAISSLRKSNADLAHLPIVIVSEHRRGGVSDALMQLDVVHVRKPILGQDAFEASSVHKARTIVTLSKDPQDPTSDSINFELVDRLRESGVRGCIIVEAVRDENRARLKKVGADYVLRPIRAYPEMLARTILAPGSVQVIETLFNSVGEECIRYQVKVSCTWLHIVQTLTSLDLGIPIAYEGADGEIVNSPSSKVTVTTQAVFVIVNEGHIKKDREIEQVLNVR